jgi:hypothetical protein
MRDGLVQVVWSVVGRVRAGPASKHQHQRERREDLRPSDVSRARHIVHIHRTSPANSEVSATRSIVVLGPATRVRVPYHHTQRALTPSAREQGEQGHPPRPKHALPYHPVVEATADAPARPISPCRHFFARRRVKQTQSHLPTARPRGLKH